MAKPPPNRFERMLDALGGRGKMIVIACLLEAGTLRYSELQRALPRLSQRRIVQCLRELEADGIVERAVHHQVPPRVDYSLTTWGRAFTSVVGSLRAWCKLWPAA
jgi:DNA-binding HxlR family transcriptional regulator